MNVVQQDAHVVLGYLLNRGVSILDIQQHGITPLLPVDGVNHRVRVVEVIPPHQSAFDIWIEPYISGCGLVYTVAVAEEATRIARFGDCDAAVSMFASYSLSETFKLKLDPFNTWFDASLVEGRMYFEHLLTIAQALPYEDDGEVCEVEAIPASDRIVHVTSRNGECSYNIPYGSLLEMLPESAFEQVLMNGPLVNTMLVPQ